MQLRGVLFDLDGVLIDSLASIADGLNHALVACGRTPRPASSLRACIGPPIEVSAAMLLETDDAAQVAAFIACYRERYEATYLTMTRAMDGLGEVLEALATRWPLAVATSKAEAYARPICAALGVEHLFAGGIHGRSLALDAEPKAAVIARALERYAGSAEGLVMVGDRSHDVVGAAIHGIPTIGALHGMGSREELLAAGAAWLVDDLRGLPPLLERLDAAWRNGQDPRGMS